jgi:hypothetical protein
MRSVGRLGVVLGVVLFVANASLALAQEGGGKGGRGGRGGPGGRGPGGPAGLLQMEVVQKDLNLDQEQIDKAKKIGTEVREKYASEFGGLRDLSQEERREKMQELGKKVNDETMAALGSVLKPEQMDRLKQIQLQQRGSQALTDPEVQKALKLTDEQKEKIKTINDDAAKERSGIGRGEGAAEKMMALRKDTNDKVMAVLTDEQKETWKTMTGKHIDLPMGGPPRPGKGKG